MAQKMALPKGKQARKNKRKKNIRDFQTGKRTREADFARGAETESEADRRTQERETRRIEKKE